VLFLRAGNALESEDSGEAKRWAAAIAEACNAVSDMGGARLGDRTMLDALIPFAQQFQQAVVTGNSLRQALETAVVAAERGAESTARLRGRRGRSSYLGDRVLGHPDPGAMAVAIWLRAVASVLNS
jgi:dihydroxyacetone kinase